MFGKVILFINIKKRDLTIVNNNTGDADIN